MELGIVEALVGLGVLVAGPGGAAWFGIKAGLNGTKTGIDANKETLDRIEVKVDGLTDSVHCLDVRTAVLEAKEG